MPDMNTAAPGGAQPPPAGGAAPLVRRRPGYAVMTHPGFVLWSFTATTFLSALLLFSVQPMFAKMVLPVLGGSPSVWSVAMVFFQGALLLGYAYAHALTRFMDPRRAVVVHLCVFGLALTALPLSPNGKVDRSLLPPPGPVRRDAPFEPARTPIESSAPR